MFKKLTLTTLIALGSLGTVPQARGMNQQVPPIDILFVQAAANGNLFNVQDALKKGANIKAEAPYQWTALHYACYNGHTEIVKFLVNIGADIEAKNIQGATPLFLACKKNHSEIIQFLIAVGAELTSLTSTRSDISALINAARLFEGIYRGKDQLEQLNIETNLFDVIKQNPVWFIPLLLRPGCTTPFITLLRFHDDLNSTKVLQTIIKGLFANTREQSPLFSNQRLAYFICTVFRSPISQQEIVAGVRQSSQAFHNVLKKLPCWPKEIEFLTDDKPCFVITYNEQD
jgi:hypothetical protein